MSAVLIARYYVKPGNSAAVREALQKMAARVKADEPALVAHRETPHFKEIIEGIIVPLLEKREREIYEQVIG